MPEYEVQGEVQLDAATTALVVIDMQNDFVSDGGSLQVPDARATIAPIRALFEQARGAGARVVYSQDTHGEGDPEFRIWPEHAREGTWGWQIVDELAPQDGDTVVRKPRYDAFYDTDLEELLEQWGTRTLVICGTVANICVHYTAASAAIRWYDVVIPRDATSALERFDLESSLRQTAFLFAGKVTDSAAIRAARRPRALPRRRRCAWKSSADPVASTASEMRCSAWAYAATRSVRSRSCARSQIASLSVTMRSSSRCATSSALQRTPARFWAHSK